MNPSVIVVGAGPGGLASAILLATAGVKVKVLERMPVVGGRTSTIETDGFKFDLGPTFFLYPRVLEEIFTAAGANLREEVELVRLDPQYRIIFGQVSANFWKKTAPNSTACCRAWKTRSSVGRTWSTCGC
jgi:phytoene desaturase